MFFCSKVKYHLGGSGRKLGKLYKSRRGRLFWHDLGLQPGFPMHNFKRNCSKHQETMPSVQFLPLQTHARLLRPERTFSVEWTVESRGRCLFLYLTSPHPSTHWFKNVEPVENKELVTGFNLVPLSGSQWAPMVCWPWGQHWTGVWDTSSLISAPRECGRVYGYC